MTAPERLSLRVFAGALLAAGGSEPLPAGPAGREPG